MNLNYNTPLISIIVPVFNCKSILEKSIECIKNQTYTNFEIILVDDGSTDGSAEICDKQAQSDQRIVVIHQRNMKAAGARNTGLDHAKGEFFLFVDSDDLVENTMLEDLVKACGEKDDLVVCKFDRYDGHVKIQQNVDSGDVISLSRKQVWDIFFVELPSEIRLEKAPYCKLYRKSVHGKTRFRGQERGQDYEYASHIMNQCQQVSYLDKTLYHYNDDVTDLDNWDGYGKWSLQIAFRNLQITTWLIDSEESNLTEYYKKQQVIRAFYHVMNLYCNCKRNHFGEEANRIQREYLSNITRFIRQLQAVKTQKPIARMKLLLAMYMPRVYATLYSLRSVS